MLDENINQPKSSTGDQPSEEPKTTPETPPSGPSERVPPGSEPTPEITPTEPTEPELPETPSPSIPVPEPSTPTPPADEPPSTTIVSTPPEKKSRLKLISGVIILILLLASIPAAVYLVQQRQEIRKEAAPGVPGDMTCLSDIVIGPGKYSFAANGVGLENRNSASFTINLPAGATALSEYVYAFWSGEKATPPQGKITINGQALTGEKIYYSSAYNGYIFRVKVPSSLITGNSLTFNISGLDFPVGVAKIHGDEKGGAHGVGIAVPYEKTDLPTTKIIIRSCGDFFYHGWQGDNYSDPIDFSFPDISPAGATLKAAFFFGEGEGDAYDKPRPNYLFYNNNQLNPTDGSPYPAYSSDDGYWWDTRVTGEDLPAITASGTTASFKALSPQEGHGDSLYFVGGILQYPVTAPTPTPTPTPTQVLTCTSLMGVTVSPGDKTTLICKGRSDPQPMNHFEFRVSIDGGAPTSLPNASATKTDSEYKGEIDYTIPDYGCYKVECRACVSTDSSNCTAWGQAGKTLATRCAKEGEVCYGFAGTPCCSGLVCVTEGGLPVQPDRGGICQRPASLTK